MQGTPSYLVLLENKGQHEVEAEVRDQTGERDVARPWRTKGL